MLTSLLIVMRLNQNEYKARTLFEPATADGPNELTENLPIGWYNLGLGNTLPVMLPLTLPMSIRLRRHGVV
jgi:hypothetical protein